MTDAIKKLAEIGCYGMGANDGPHCFHEEVYQDFNGKCCQQPCWSCMATMFLFATWLSPKTMMAAGGPFGEVNLSEVGELHLANDHLRAENAKLRKAIAYMQRTGLSEQADSIAREALAK